MNRLFEFLNKERLYILLLIFIILINAASAMPGSAKKTRGPDAMRLEAEKAGEREEPIFMSQDEAKKLFEKRPAAAVLLSMASLLIIATLLLGILIDTILASLGLAKRRLDIITYRPDIVRWGLLDVVKVVILFLFFGYMLVLTESALAREFPIIKNDNFRMILNSSILDILTVVFILYFAVSQHREKLISLGLSFKNFFKNVFYGIVGYIATVPILALVLFAVVLVMNVTKYIPEKQAVVELFLKEKDVAFLMYTSVFAAIVGPFIEELFFRGFMYNALKKYIGIFWATALTAALFASLHANLAGFLPIMVLGILLAYIYERTGTLVSSITVHMIHNLSMVFLVFLVKGIRVY